MTTSAIDAAKAERIATKPVLVRNGSCRRLAGLKVGFPGTLGLAPSYQRHRRAIGLDEGDWA